MSLQRLRAPMCPYGDCRVCANYLFEAWERMTSGGVEVSTEDADMVFPEFIEPYVVCSERWQWWNTYDLKGEA